MEYDSSAWTGRVYDPYPVYIDFMSENFSFYLGFDLCTYHRLSLEIGFWRKTDLKQGEYIYKFRFNRRWFAEYKRY